MVYKELQHESHDENIIDRVKNIEGGSDGLFHLVSCTHWLQIIRTCTGFGSGSNMSISFKTTTKAATFLAIHFSFPKTFMCSHVAKLFATLRSQTYLL